MRDGLFLMVVAQYWPLGFKLWRPVLTTTNVFIKAKVNKDQN